MAATQARPDIANSVRAVAKYCAEPREIHLKTALGTLAYIKGMSGVGITFQRGLMDGLLMQVFADADYSSKATDRGSVSGGLILCGGACVQWFSRNQKCVTLPPQKQNTVQWQRLRRKCYFCSRFSALCCREWGHLVCRCSKITRVLCSSRKAL